MEELIKSKTKGIDWNIVITDRPFLFLRKMVVKATATRQDQSVTVEASIYYRNKEQLDSYADDIVKQSLGLLARKTWYC